MQPLTPFDVVSPSVSLELFGGKVGAVEEGLAVATSYYDAGTSRTATKDGLAPSWNHEFCAACWEPESTMLMLSINKGPQGGDVLARACAPVGALRLGYRVMLLRSPNGSRMDEGRSVLCHISTEPIEATASKEKEAIERVAKALRGAGLE